MLVLFASTIAIAQQRNETKVTLGQGEFDLGDESINRDVNQTENELKGVDIKPLHFFIPIPNLSENGVHFKEYLNRIGKCATGFDCMRHSAREILRGMGWLDEDGRKLNQDEKDWRDIFNEQVKFSKEITEEEAKSILDEVEKEYAEFDKKLDEKMDEAVTANDADAVADAAYAKLMSERAKAQEAQSLKQKIVEERAKTPEAKAKAQQQRAQFEKEAKQTREEAQNSFASKGTKSSLEKEFQKEKARLEKAKDLTGLEHLKVLEDLLKGDGNTVKDQNKFFEEASNYAKYKGYMTVTADLLQAAFVAAATKNPRPFLKVLATHVLKTGLREEFKQWAGGGGVGQASEETTGFLPGKGENWIKLKGDQGWKNLKEGTIWKKDQLHKDHWDISDFKGNKIKEVDFFGRQIWPDGPKNKNKK